MSAAVAARPTPHNPPRSSTRAYPSTRSTSASRMGGSSPADPKKHVKVEDGAQDPPGEFVTPAHPNDPPGTAARGGPEQPTTLPANPEPVTAASNAATLSQPLAPPPRPAPTSVPETPDYFSSLHHGSHLALEPNPFEQSFGNTTAETPGKSLLPPVAALTSPAPLVPGSGASAGFGWPNSLRAGPLSPAMLTGPAAATDYFDGQLRASFPTPNESSLRTGLTPGGGGSMFPVSSPGGQALFQHLAGVAPTPGTLDFHRTAMAAAARRSDPTFGSSLAATAATTAAPPASSTVDALPTTVAATLDDSDLTTTVTASAAPADASNVADPFGAHDANDAANGLFLLAQAGDGTTPQARYAVDAPMTAAPQPAPVVVPQRASPPRTKRAARPNTATAAAAAAAAAATTTGGSVRNSLSGMSEMGGEVSESGNQERSKANGKSKNRKASGAATAPKAGQTTTARRKADEAPPARAPASKKSKAAAPAAMMMDRRSESLDDEDMIMAQAEAEADAEMASREKETGRKMTDEEKRKNFLERNRVAALKCRQRKKQWLANLQAKVEIFSSENDALSAQVQQLREEVVNLKTLLLAHKDCPVSQAQGISAMSMNGLAGDYGAAGHPHPYGLAMANAANSVMAGRGIPRS